jgi:hypothetical protein
LEQGRKRAVHVFVDQPPLLVRRCTVCSTDVCTIYDGPFGIDGSRALFDKLDEGRVDGHAAKEGDIEIVGHDGTAALAEDVCALAAVWADEARHVLNHTEDADARLAAEVELLLHVGDGDGLWCGDDDGACELTRGGRLLEERLEQRDVLVGGAWGRVDEQVVEPGPQDVGQELADHGRLLGPAPDDGVAAVGEDEAEGHARDGADGDCIAGGGCSIGGGGQRVRLVDVDGNPAAGGLADLFVLDAKEARNRGPRQINVEHADAVALQRQAEGELRRDARLAYPAFARQHEHNLVDLVERHCLGVVAVQSATPRYSRSHRLGAAEGIVVVQSLVGGANVSALKSWRDPTSRHSHLTRQPQPQPFIITNVSSFIN